MGFSERVSSMRLTIGNVLYVWMNSSIEFLHHVVSVFYSFKEQVVHIVTGHSFCSNCIIKHMKYTSVQDCPSRRKKLPKNQPFRRYEPVHYRVLFLSVINLKNDFSANQQASSNKQSSSTNSCRNFPRDRRSRTPKANSLKKWKREASQVPGTQIGGRHGKE